MCLPDFIKTNPTIRIVLFFVCLTFSSDQTQNPGRLTVRTIILKKGEYILEKHIILFKQNHKNDKKFYLFSE